MMDRKELPTLKDLRTERGITQAHLASRLGIHQAALSRLEGRSDVSVSMLKSFVEALGGKLQIAAVFPNAAVSLDKLADTPTVGDLQTLVLQQCYIHPMPPDRATDRFMIRRLDESLLELEKLSNRQIVEIPVRRVLEVLPATSSGLPTIVLRGSLQWSAHEKLWKVALE
jgi:transcriptional regulator with XRE-family HTH domain